MQETSRIPPLETVDRLLSVPVSTEEHAPAPGEGIVGQRKIADHLANERTFLAWIRTALAVVTFGTALGRLGGSRRAEHMGARLLLCSAPLLVGMLTLLAICFMLVALLHFLQIRQEIEQEQVHLRQSKAILLTVFSCLMAGVLTLFMLTN